jgi:hypothetical protein
MPTIFSPDQLKDIVEKTIPKDTADEQHNFAVVGGIDQDGAQVVARFERDHKGKWKLDADAVWRHEWTGEDKVGAQVLLKW